MRNLKMGRRRSNKRKSKESPLRGGFLKPQRHCRKKPINPHFVRILRSKTRAERSEQNAVLSPKGEDLKIHTHVSYKTATTDVKYIDERQTQLLNSNTLKVGETKVQPIARLPEYTERVVTYKPGHLLNISVIANTDSRDSNTQPDNTSETALPENTLQFTEADDEQAVPHTTIMDDCLISGISHIKNKKARKPFLLDHITILDESDIEKDSRKSTFRETEFNNVFDMSTLKIVGTSNDMYQTVDVAGSDRTLNDMYQTVDVAGSDSDDIISINDCDEYDVTYINTTMIKKKKKKRKKSIIVIEDDSVLEIANTPASTNNNFDVTNNNNENGSNTIVLPHEFTPSIASTPCRYENNVGASWFNSVEGMSGMQMPPPLPSTSIPVSIKKNLNIPRCTQNHPLAGTLRNHALQMQQQLQRPHTTSTIGCNFLNANDVRFNGLRPIFIDGSNVAYGHANGKCFSVKGIKICIDYFKMRGHEVTAIVPQFRKERSQNSDYNLLERLEKDGTVIFTPSRKVKGRTIVPYDDRYIVLLAHVYKGIIVSADNFRDVLEENLEWLDTIQNRILTPTWLKDMIIFPTDPLGRFGPNLDEFLKFPN